MNTVIQSLLYPVVLNTHSVILDIFLSKKQNILTLFSLLHFIVYVWNKIIEDKICILLSGTFELTDSERRATGTITVELKWKFVYLPPSGSTMAADLVNYIQNEKSIATKLPAEEKTQTPALPLSFTPSVTVSNLTNSQKLRDIKDLLQQFIYFFPDDQVCPYCEIMHSTNTLYNHHLQHPLGSEIFPVSKTL